jgi:hypothetical protein
MDRGSHQTTSSSPIRMRQQRRASLGCRYRKPPLGWGHALAVLLEKRDVRVLGQAPARRAIPTEGKERASRLKGWFCGQQQLGAFGCKSRSRVDATKRPRDSDTTQGRLGSVASARSAVQIASKYLGLRAPTVRRHHLRFALSKRFANRLRRAM